MKKSAILAALFISLSLSAAAQKKGVLIAKGTTITETEKSFKIVSSDEGITTGIIKAFEGTELTRYQVAIKTDRVGSYREYTFYFKQEDKAKVLDRFKKTDKE